MEEAVHLAVLKKDVIFTPTVNVAVFERRSTGVCEGVPMRPGDRLVDVIDEDRYQGATYVGTLEPGENVLVVGVAERDGYLITCVTDTMAIHLPANTPNLVVSDNKIPE